MEFTIDTGNKEFQDALNLIQYTRQSVFLTGKAGTGKSTFLKYICKNTKKKHIELAHTGITMLVVTHEMGFAREVSNRVIFIDDGKIQEDEPPQELFTNPKHPRLKAVLSKML